MTDVYIFPLITLLSWLLTELIRRYTFKNNFIDIPNERSSHTVPTPRGGGISIVLIFLISISFIDVLDDQLVWALLGSGILVAGIGFWDDKGHVPAKWRLLAHFAAAIWVMFFLGSLPEFQILGFNIQPGWIGAGIVAFLLVWMLNLFNFMDGIDGLAASETIFVTCAGAFFSWLNGLEGLITAFLVLAASTTGFLILNWPPAKIFMGDVGSGFLGLIIASLVYASILKGGSIWLWLILLAVFIVDSGITLFRRIINGERWHEAHCSHAYQHASKIWGHQRVTVVTAVINLFWLFPLAYVVYLMPDINKDIVVFLTITAYVPLVMLALKFKAGLAANTSSYQ